MTWATIHYIDGHEMAVDFAYSAHHKNAIAAMTGATWDKATKRWHVPVSTVGAVVRLFWPDVTVDYDVLRARDEQLQRMFRGYLAMGVRFDVVDGKVTCDHAMLNEWFSQNGTALHVGALRAVLATPYVKSPKTQSRPVSASHAANGDLALWLRGVKSAHAKEEKKAAMLKRKRGR